MEKIAKHSKKSFLVAISLLMLSASGAAFFGHSVAAQTAPPVCAAGKRGTAAAPCTPSQTIQNQTPPPAGNIITDYVNPAIKLLTALIGVVIVLAVVVAGIQYSSAGGDPSGVAAAKKRISAAILALVVYVFILGFLQWLVPGGLV